MAVSLDHGQLISLRESDDSGGCARRPARRASVRGTAAIPACSVSVWSDCTGTSPNAGVGPLCLPHVDAPAPLHADGSCVRLPEIGTDHHPLGHEVSVVEHAR